MSIKQLLMSPWILMLLIDEPTIVITLSLLKSDYGQSQGV